MPGRLYSTGTLGNEEPGDDKEGAWENKEGAWENKEGAWENVR